MSADGRGSRRAHHREATSQHARCCARWRASTPRILKHGRAAIADLRASAAGDGVRAAQALARSDHRFRLAARLRVADRARRTGDGRIARSARAALRRARRWSSPKAWPRTCSTCSRSSSDVKVNRQWAGHGRHDAGLRADHGHDAGAKASSSMRAGAPGDSRRRRSAGKTMAHTVATDRNHELIAGFRLERFARYELTGEKGAASVGH